MAPNEIIIEHTLRESADLNIIPGAEKAVDKASELEKIEKDIKEYEKIINKPFYKRTDVKWVNLYFLVALHAIALYGFITFPYLEKWRTFVWCKYILDNNTNSNDNLLSVSRRHPSRIPFAYRSRMRRVASRHTPIYF